jgi:general transcription factor 3C polypeptide 6
MSATPNSLCPGYKEVDEFGPDEEYEDEEVFYVTLDMGNVEPSLVPSSSSYRLIVSLTTDLRQWNTVK